MRLSSVVCATMALLLASQLASADTITHFGDGVGPGLGTILDSVGIGSGNAAAETTATSFTVPGNPQDTVNLTFTFQQDLGSYLFDFGFFNTADVTADPNVDRQLYATQALAGATLVFADIADNPGAVSTKAVAGGTTLGFFLIPNNTLATFNANPAPFFAYVPNPNSIDFDPFNPPMFSNSAANLGQFDQLLSFAGNGATLFAWEDSTRAGFSDNSFTDLVFSLDSQLVPVPEPTGVLMMAVGTILLPLLALKEGAESLSSFRAFVQSTMGRSDFNVRAAPFGVPSMFIGLRGKSLIQSDGDEETLAQSRHMILGIRIEMEFVP